MSDYPLPLRPAPSNPGVITVGELKRWLATAPDDGEVWIETIDEEVRSTSMSNTLRSAWQLSRSDVLLSAAKEDG